MSLTQIDDRETQERIANLEEKLEHARQPDEINTLTAALYQITGLAYARCTRCGCITTLGQRLKPSANGLLCPSCDEATKAIPPVIVVFIAGAAFLLTLAMARAIRWTDGLLFWAINLLLITVFAWLLLIPHELGHALAAHLMGGRVYELSFGRGRLLWQRQVGRIFVSIRPPAFTAGCVAVFSPAARMQLRLAVYAGGGICANAAILGMLSPWFRLAPLGRGINVMACLLIANVLLLLISAIPFSNASFNGALYDAQAYSDGMAIVHALTNTEPPTTFLRISLSAEWFYAVKAKAHAAAVKIAQKGLDRFPDDPYFLNMLGTALLEDEQYAEASAIFRKLLHQGLRDVQEAGMSPERSEATFVANANNLACALLHGATTPAEAWQAHWYAGRAYRMLPWLTSAKSTWGEALIQKGHIQEGIRHLLNASRLANDFNSKASMLAYAALGYLQLPDQENVLQLLKKARGCDRDNRAVRKAEQALAAARVL